MAGFHEVRFPEDISYGSRGGPERRTDVVTLRSGAEERNALWADSRRRYNALCNVRKPHQIEAVISFWEERRGRLYGFRWKDWFDYRSAIAGAAISATDQSIGVGDGATRRFQLRKTYGSVHAPWSREIRKPVAGSVRVAVAGGEQASGWSVDPTTGIVTLSSAPAPGAIVQAGYEFDVPVRFDADSLNISHLAFDLGDIPDLPVVEIRG
jgi:uncharacterized protein (TIGR02217 family)